VARDPVLDLEPIDEPIHQLHPQHRYACVVELRLAQRRVDQPAERLAPVARSKVLETGLLARRLLQLVAVERRVPGTGAQIP
jgi:hypothetical protein